MSTEAGSPAVERGEMNSVTELVDKQDQTQYSLQETWPTTTAYFDQQILQGPVSKGN